MIQEYIDSGILETYVLGIATEEEVKQLLYMKAEYPEVNSALKQLELDMEKIAGQMAVTPPPHLWNKIEQEINEVIPKPETAPQKFNKSNNNGKQPDKDGETIIELLGQSSHMRIHKAWRWVFAAVFVIGKIFLGFAIYFYLENRQ